MITTYNTVTNTFLTSLWARILQKALLVSRLKSVEAMKLEFVAPMPEKIATSTMQFLKVPEKLC